MRRKGQTAGLVPAGSTTTSRRQLPDGVDDSPLFANPAAAPAVNLFELTLGGRPGLVSELLTSPDLTTRMQKILQLILDPRFDGYSLAHLCDKAKILPGEVFAAFRDAKIAKANIQALSLVADRLPGVIEALLLQAVDREVGCGMCQGLKVITPEPSKVNPNPQPEPCAHCEGRGILILRADLEAQKIALELVGLLKKNSGVQIGIQQTQNNLNVPEGSASGGLTQLQQAVSGLLFGTPLTLPGDLPPTGEVVEAEIVLETE